MLDRVDQSPDRTQLKGLIEHALNVNKQRMVEADTHSWYCKLRSSKEYDHAFDGVNTNIKFDSKKNEKHGTVIGPK